MAKRIIAIMAPTYLPWIGYFDMIDQSDFFVFLDCVQYKKRSWQQRNQILGPNKTQWLSVSVQSKGRFHQTISEVTIDRAERSTQKHLKTIHHFYAKAPFFNNYFKEFSEVLLEDYGLLVELNMSLIHWFSEKLGIKTEFLRSQTLETEGTKGDLLFSIAAKLKADCYLSATGSKVFFDEHNPFASSNIELIYHNYEHPEYSQLHSPFVPYMSVLDLLFNEGPNSLAVIRKNRVNVLMKNQ